MEPAERDRLLDRAVKARRLALESPVPGERAAARAALDRLLQSLQMSEDQLESALKPPPPRIPFIVVQFHRGFWPGGSWTGTGSSTVTGSSWTVTDIG